MKATNTIDADTGWDQNVENVTFAGVGNQTGTLGAWIGTTGS